MTSQNCNLPKTKTENLQTLFFRLHIPTQMLKKIIQTLLLPPLYFHQNSPHTILQISSSFSSSSPPPPLSLSLSLSLCVSRAGRCTQRDCTAHGTAMVPHKGPDIVYVCISRYVRMYVCMYLCSEGAVHSENAMHMLCKWYHMKGLALWT